MDAKQFWLDAEKILGSIKPDIVTVPYEQYHNIKVLSGIDDERWARFMKELADIGRKSLEFKVHVKSQQAWVMLREYLYRVFGFRDAPYTLRLNSTTAPFVVTFVFKDRRECEDMKRFMRMITDSISMEG